MCSAGIRVQVVQAAVGEVSLIIKDAARNLQTIQGVCWIFFQHKDQIRSLSMDKSLVLRERLRSIYFLFETETDWSQITAGSLTNPIRSLSPHGPSLAQSKGDAFDNDEPNTSHPRSHQMLPPVPCQNHHMPRKSRHRAQECTGTCGLSILVAGLRSQRKACCSSWQEAWRPSWCKRGREVAPVREEW